MWIPLKGFRPRFRLSRKPLRAARVRLLVRSRKFTIICGLLFSSIGLPHCHLCGSPIARQSTDQIIHSIRELPHGERVMILAPLVRGRKGEFKKEIEGLRTSGFTRARVDGEMISLDDEIKLDKRKNHTIDVVVDRLMIKEGVGHRLEEAVKIATKLTDGVVIVSVIDGEEKMYSERMACVNCGISIPQLEPRSFSFNSAFGACKECHGIGSKHEVDPHKLVIDDSVPINKMTFFDNSYLDFYVGESLLAIARHFDIAPETPFGKLPKKARDAWFYGLPDKLTYHHGSYKYQGNWQGVKQWLHDQLNKEAVEIAKGEDGETNRTKFGEYVATVNCPDCQGRRLQPESLAVRVNGFSISDYTTLTLNEAAKAFAKLKLNAREEIIAGRILKEIRERLSFLQAVGLSYLTLDRASGSLSGGEGQRIRLATQIGSQLRGVLYVLDEPSIGLHPRDNQKLLDTLQRLRDIGNTVIVVEHDEDTMRRADYIVDLGPAAGTHGGEVVAVGKPADIEQVTASLTGQYLSGAVAINVPSQRRSPNGKSLIVRDATEHNLKHLDVTFPLGLLTVVTGVSGSGKSTLVEDILYRSIARKLYRSLAEPGAHKAIEGLEHIDKIIEIDQSPIGRTPRSNPATYTGLFTPVRELYAMLPESKERGYKPGRFSFNVKGGRCEACQGDGMKRIEMNFLPDVYVTCEVCRGSRYNRETLEVRYQGKNIAQLLDTTIEDALEPLQNHPQIKQKLQTLHDVGLGYIKLGQAATTLSGGEAQRIKLSKELSKRATGRTVYILDEPTTGLHFEDVRKLIDVLQKLVGMGNTVIIIEHNLDVMKSADWLIDLGPEGGEGGGRVIAEGTPEEVARNKKSYTGQALRIVLNGHVKK